MATSTNGNQNGIVDISVYPTAQKLNARCAEFLAEVEDLWVITGPLSSPQGNLPFEQDTWERSGRAPEHRLRSRQPLIPRLLQMHPPRPAGRLGRRNQARRRPIPPRQNRPPQRRHPLLQRHDRVHGQSGRLLGSAPRAPVRRDQLRRAGRWDGGAQGHAGLAGRRVDEPGARDASLSAGPRRAAGRFVLSARGEDLVQGGSGGSAAGLRLSERFTFPVRTYVGGGSDHAERLCLTHVWKDE